MIKPELKGSKSVDTIVASTERLRKFTIYKRTE